MLRVFHLDAMKSSGCGSVGTGQPQRLFAFDRVCTSDLYTSIVHSGEDDASSRATQNALQRTRGFQLSTRLVKYKKLDAVSFDERYLFWKAKGRERFVDRCSIILRKNCA